MIAVLPDETSAFEAYQLLWRHGIPPQNLALVGKGYSNPDHVGLEEPRQIAKSSARNGSIILGTLTVLALLVSYFGFGLRLNPSVRLVMWQELAALLSISLIFGCGFGAILGFFYGVFFKSSTSIACRNCLKRGQYLLLLEGSEPLIKKAKQILWQTEFPDAL